MTILVGYTQTAEGHAALRHGVDAASSTGKPLSIFPLAPEADAAGDPELSSATAAGATLLEPQREGAHPAEDLLDIAAETGASLIVIGVRNRSRVSKLLMGSDAQRIILNSPVPVLTVRAANDER